VDKTRGSRDDVAVALSRHGCELSETKKKATENGCFAFLALVLGAIVLSIYHSGKNSEPRDPCKDNIAAFVMAQEFVSRQLKAPGSAEYPWFSDPLVSVANLGGCRFVVSGYVDAENSFGAKLRSRFVVELGRQGNNWTAYEVKILER
jgi:hypothetical protein